MSEKTKDVLERVIKTFVEGFFGVAIPQAIIILSNVTDYDFSNFKAWGIPLVCGAVAAGISAVWNGLQKKKEV